MPITSSAKKELRKGKRKRLFNEARKRTMRDRVKAIKRLVTVKDPIGAEAKISAAYQAIDKAVKKGVIKKKAAARKKSRLIKMIKKAKVAV